MKIRGGSRCIFTPPESNGVCFQKLIPSSICSIFSTDHQTSKTSQTTLEERYWHRLKGSLLFISAQGRAAMASATSSSMPPGLFFMRVERRHAIPKVAKLESSNESDKAPAAMSGPIQRLGAVRRGEDSGGVKVYLHPPRIEWCLFSEAHSIVYMLDFQY